MYCLCWSIVPIATTTTYFCICRPTKVFRVELRCKNRPIFMHDTLENKRNCISLSIKILIHIAYQNTKFLPINLILWICMGIFIMTADQSNNIFTVYFYLKVAAMIKFYLFLRHRKQKFKWRRICINLYMAHSKFDCEEIFEHWICP